MKIIRFLYNNIFDTGILTYSAQDPGVSFLAKNVRQRWHTRHWRSGTGNVSNQWLKVNKGSGYSASCIIVKYNNFTSAATVKLQASNVDEADWSLAPLQVTLSPIYNDILIKFFTETTYQWWRLYINDSANPNNYIRIGRVFLGTFFSPSKNFDNKYSRITTDPSTLSFSEGGQISSILRSKFHGYQYPFTFMTKTDRDNFETIFQTVGQIKDLFVVQDADDLPDSAYYARIVNMFSVDHEFMDEYFHFTIMIEELR